MKKFLFPVLAAFCMFFCTHGKVFFYDLDNDAYSPVDSNRKEAKQASSKSVANNSFGGRRITENSRKTCKTYLPSNRVYEVKSYSTINTAAKNKSVRNIPSKVKKNVENGSNIQKVNSDLFSENNRLIRENTRLLRENSKLLCEVRDALADLKKRLDEYEKQ